MLNLNLNSNLDFELLIQKNKFSSFFYPIFKKLKKTKQFRAAPNARRPEDLSCPGLDKYVDQEFDYKI